MNKNQKRILVAVLAIIVGMLAYPPFQIVNNNGVVFNMGYGWIVDPPNRGYIKATVNVAMLLIQWIGVLVVGGLAFLLAKSVQRQSNTSSSNPQNERLNTDQSHPEYSSYSEVNTTYNPVEFYKAIVGPKNQDYYLRHFSRFDSTGQVGVSWHWPAFFVPFYWFLYRKMWLNAFLYLFLPVPLGVVVSAAGGSAGAISGIVYALYLAGIVFLTPMYANALYYKHCKKKISEASASSSDFQRQIGEISAKGGTSRGLIFVLVFVSLVSIGILAAIAIPQFQGYKTRGQKAAGIKNNEFGRQGKIVTDPDILAQLEGPSPTGEIAIVDLNGEYAQNVEAGNIFVVTGRAVNNTDKARSFFQVKGNLFNKMGEKVAQSEVYCGNIFSKKEIETLPRGKIETDLKNKVGGSLSNINLAPGKSVPFMIVFFKLPAEMSEFSAEVTGSQPGIQLDIEDPFKPKDATKADPYTPDNESKKKNGKLSIYTEYKYGTTDVYIDGVLMGQ